MQAALSPTALVVLAGTAELRKPLFQMVGQHRFSEQIGRGAIIVEPGGFLAQVVPFIDGAVAAAAAEVEESAAPGKMARSRASIRAVLNTLLLFEQSTVPVMLHRRARIATASMSEPLQVGARATST